MSASGCARKISSGMGQGSGVPLLGTGHDREWALWRLSLVLAEIASHDKAKTPVESQEKGKLCGDSRG